jgi:hypothetical protein
MRRLLVPVTALTLSCSSVVEVGQSSGGSGGGPALTGNVVWAKSYGDGEMEPRVVGVDGQGNVVFTGPFHGTIDFGCGPVTAALSPPEGSGYAIVKLSAGGGCLWNKIFENKVGQGIELWGGVIPDDAGNLRFAGFVGGGFDLGGGPQGTPGAEWASAVVLALDPAGNYLWERRFGSMGGFAQIVDMAGDGAGDVFVTGALKGTVDLGSGPLKASGPSDVFLFGLDPSGAPVWSRSFGGGGEEWGSGVAQMPGGDVLLAGNEEEAIDFGSGPVPGKGGFLARLGPQGDIVWGKHLDFQFPQIVEQGGAIYVTGTAKQAVDFGNGPMPFSGIAGDTDVVLGKLDPSGKPIWSKHFGDAAPQNIQGIVADPQGTVTIAGVVTGGIDLGDGPIAGSADGQDLFAAKLDPSGAALWARRFAGNKTTFVDDVAPDPSGGVVLVGEFEGTLSAGDTPLVSGDGPKVFVVRLAP